MACRIDVVTRDAASWIGVLPSEVSGVGRVGIDEAAQFAHQIGDTGEDAARRNLSFDPGEPEFD